jgi:ATP sulfurylase
MKVSSYEKLRLRPDEVRAVFQSAGLRVTLSQGARGMVHLIADA